MMAAAKIAHQHTLDIPTFSKTSGASQTKHITDINPTKVVQEWLDRFSHVLSSGQTADLSSVIHEQAWWRDHLALSWDLRTLNSLQNIVDFLESRSAVFELGELKLVDSGQFQPDLVTPLDDLTWLESMFHFKTKNGSGKGMLRLVHCQGTWKAHMLYTALQSIRGVTELARDHRPHGGNNSWLGGVGAGNWQERRDKQKNFEDEEPAVLLIGAGQAGLNLAARLQTMGISCLLIDKNGRIGDNWRHRYRTLVTHDPVQYCHMAYMPFPANWPLFTPKDKLGDWFETYASAMELNVWLKTTIQSARYSDERQEWTVTVERGDSGQVERTLHPKHVVFCTGQAGEARIPSFPGQELFNGRLYHASQHQDASLSDTAIKGKRVLVVGTGNSGHDIAQNYYENGADVAMLQRDGTYVITAKKGLFMLHTGLYEEHGPPTDDADVYGQSLPIPVQFALNVGGTAKILAAEKDTLEGLAKAGFKLDFGHDGSGIYRKYIERGGGYYIDGECEEQEPTSI